MEIKEERFTPQWSEFKTFFGDDLNAWAIAKEKAIEENVIKMLEELNIHASVKSDRYSLPAHGYVLSKAGKSSYVPDVYNSASVKRKLLKVLLEEDCRKVRFYVYIYTTEVEGATGFQALFSKKFIIEIRYYLHD